MVYVIAVSIAQTAAQNSNCKWISVGNYSEEIIVD
jgi:hypothetical protein